MAYNYPPPGRYGGQNAAPSYPAAFPPPGMGAPPGMGGAPGMSPPPGMSPAATSLPGRPPSIPAQFQPPPNMPANLNFNAPVIRLGVGGGAPLDARGGGRDMDSMGGGGERGNRNRLGLGNEGRDFGRRQDVASFSPPTLEEVRRTIFVGGLEEGVPDDAQLESVLGANPIRLRRWTRVTDADGKKCRFGFAEFEDAISLHLAKEVFADGIEVPLRDKTGHLVKDDDDKIKKAKLLIVVDEKSSEYIEQWSKSDANDFQFKLDTAKDELNNILAHFASAETLSNGNGLGHGDANGDTAMEDKSHDAELITILPTSAANATEDELSDIPAEMRETVAAEIKAFRDRSIQRDIERLKKEEEMEAAERARSRPSRLASPPVSAPTGPGGANGVPVGPRGSAVAGAPSGPKGYRGAQMPKDYADGVAFTNNVGINHEDSDDEAADSDIEQRKKDKKAEELEKVYLDQERRWLNVERRHIAAISRADADEEADAAATAARRNDIADRLASFDDEDERQRASELFYRDRKAWLRARRDFLRSERAKDDKDRADEAKEQGRERARIDAARGAADDFLASTGAELAAREQAKSANKRAFTLNLGNFGAAADAGVDVEGDDEAGRGDAMAPTSAKQSYNDMANLLDDDDEVDTGERKPLKIDFKPLAAGEKMTDEQRRTATRDLATSIPNDSAGLFAWDVKWSSLSDSIVERELRPYVEKKIMEALGVQEDLLVDMVEGVIKKHGDPKEIVDALEDVLDEEAEALARKVWRMVVFCSESEARGLGASLGA